MELMTKKATKRGYAVRALCEDHSIWIRASRLRVVFFGCDKSVGHAAGADWIVNFVTEAMDYRELALTT